MDLKLDLIDLDRIFILLSYLTKQYLILFIASFLGAALRDI